MVKKRPRRWKRQKLVGLILAGFLILVLTLGIQVYQIAKASVWDGETPITLAVTTSPVKVVTFRPAEKSLIFFTFPEGAYLEAGRGYGNYLIESIYPLGELEGKGRGGDLLAKSLQENLGVPLDGYLSTDNLKEIKELLESKTNLSRGDLLRLWWQTRSVRQNKIKQLKLEEPLDPERLEAIIGPYFGEEKMRVEALAIAVLNATSRPGLAAKEARIIKNLGGRVIGLGDIENLKFKIENLKCQTRSQKKDKDSYTVKRLTKIFGCLWGGEDLLGQRAEVVLVLGEMI